MEIMEILGKTSLFEGLNEEQLKRIASIAEQREYSFGETIFEEGAPGDALYIVEEGEVKIVKKDIRKEKDRTLIILGGGKFFGEMAFFDQAPRSAGAVAIASTTLWRITVEKFTTTLAEEDPEILIKVLRNVNKALSQRLRRLDEEIIYTAQWGLES